MRRVLLAAFGILTAFALCISPAAARDDIRIGVTGTFTGPAAAIGIPYKQASELFPAKVAGRSVTWIVLDDGGDPGAAVKNARRFTDEDKVDVFLGSTSPPGSMAMFDVATEPRRRNFRSRRCRFRRPSRLGCSIYRRPCRSWSRPLSTIWPRRK